MKTFISWIEEDMQTPDGMVKRIEKLQPGLTPPPLQLAEHVWAQCAINYSVEFEKFFTELKAVSHIGFTGEALLKKFRKSMTDALLSNAVPVQPEEIKLPTELERSAGNLESKGIILTP